MRNRFYALDGMRGIAAIVVMIYHYDIGALLVSYAPTFSFYYSYVAVDLFFLLSGFVIAHSYGECLWRTLPLREYIARRVIRLYPMFLLGLFLGAPAFFWMATLQAGMSHAEVVTSFLLNLFWIPYLHQALPNPLAAANPFKNNVFPVNPPYWSLFFEMLCNGVFLLLVRLNRYGMILFMSILLAIWGRAGMFGAPNVGWGEANFAQGIPRALMGFSIGVALYRIYRFQEARTTKNVFSRSHASYVLYAVLFLLLATSSPWMLWFSHGRLLHFVLFQIFPVLLVYAGAHLGELARGETKVAEILGWLSYPVYCLHNPVWRMIQLITPVLHLSEWSKIAMGVSVTLVLSCLLTRYIEEPVRKFLSGVWMNKKTAQKQTIAV